MENGRSVLACVSGSNRDIARGGSFALRGRGFILPLFLFVAIFAHAQPPGLAQKSAQVKQLMQAGRFAEAVPICEELVKALPANPGLRLNLGMALQMSGHAREAIPEFERVLKMDPNNLPASVSLGMARLETNDPANAINPLERALKLDPANVNARGMLAGALLGVGRASEAEVQYRKLAQAAPNDPKVWQGLGHSYEALAQQAFDQLTKSAQGSPEWLVLVAESRMVRRQYRSAFFFYKQALEKQPRFRPALAGLAAVYRATNHADWAAAEEAKEKSLPPPDCIHEKPECEFSAGRYLAAASAPSLYWRSRAYDELARDAFAKLGALPESVELHAIKAEIAASQGRHLDAAGEWRAARKLEPNDTNLELSVASALHDAGDYKGALAILTKVNQKAPDIEYLIGNSLLRSEQPEEAIPHLEAALRGAPKLLPAQAALGSAYVTVGKPAAAIPHLQAALAADDDGSLHYQLARAYQAAGDTAKAKQAMKQYQQIQARNESEKRDLEEKTQIVAP